MSTKFFASANSYNGFYSLFDNIFSSEKFDKIFVIKGGPGTGKSSLMQSVNAFVKERGGETDLYYCSSDTNSLDGIIIKMGEKSVAVIDGTAPHQRDANFPVVIDEIVNLAEGLDPIWIRTKRDDIITLSSQKSNAYKAAYSYLKLAGECYKVMHRKRTENFYDNSALKYIRENLCEHDFKDERVIHKRFVSSFSKDGYKTFSEPYDKHNIITKVGGDKTCAEILLKFIAEKISCKKLEISPSPLSPDFPEKIAMSEKQLICIGTDSYDITSNNFFKISKTDLEEIRLSEKMHEVFLSEAARWLSIASDMHFRLEDIYQRAMNFDNNTVIFDKICKNILKVCDYSS
jgi:hypothetical protein